MQTHDTLSDTFDRSEPAGAERERALARLAELVRLTQNLEDMPAADRPVPLPMLRRAVFAAYRAAVRAGAKAEAGRILRRHTHAAAT